MNNKIYYVTLRLWVDGDRYNAPDQWDWATLIDISDDDVSVVSVGEALPDV